MEEKMIGFIGLGNMAKAIIGGLLQDDFVKPQQIIGSAKSTETKQNVAKEFGILIAQNNQEVAKKADVLILAVKPQMIDDILEEIKKEVKEEVLVLSILAGKTIGYLEKGLGRKVKLARCMPNTAALVKASCSGVCFNEKCQDEDKQVFLSILQSIGMAKEIPEHLMDAVIGASGSSPAFVFMMIEALADGVVRAGMSRELAYEMVAQAVYGSAKLMLESEQVLGKKMHPAALKDMVCSPGGTTIEGVKVLEENGFRGTLIKAVDATVKRSKEL